MTRLSELLKSKATKPFCVLLYWPPSISLVHVPCRYRPADAVCYPYGWPTTWVQYGRVLLCHLYLQCILCLSCLLRLLRLLLRP